MKQRILLQNDFYVVTDSTGLLDLERDLDFSSGDLDLFPSGEGLFLSGDFTSIFPSSPVVTPLLSLVEMVVVEMLLTMAGLSALPPLTGDRDLLADLDLALLPDLDLALLPDLESLALDLDLERTGERDRDLLTGEAVLLVLENFLSFLNKLSIFLFF